MDSDRLRWFRVTMLLVFVAACSQTPNLSSPEDVGNGEIVFVDPPSVGLSAADVRFAANITLSYEILRYRSVVSSEVPGLFSGSIVREGTYSVSRDLGSGAMSFGDGRLSNVAAGAIAGDQNLTFDEVFQAVEGLKFEYAVVSNVFWQGLPDATTGGVRWVGVEAEDFTTQFGSDPRITVDGGTYLTLLLEAMAEVEGVAIGENGAATWMILFEADAIAPLAAGSGTVQRLLDAGFSGETGLLSPGTVEVDVSGAISHVTVDVSTWWAEGIRSTAGAVTDIDVSLAIAFAAVDEVPSTADICAEPEVNDDGPVPQLICPLS